MWRKQPKVKAEFFLTFKNWFEYIFDFNQLFYSIGHDMVHHKLEFRIGEPQLTRIFLLINCWTWATFSESNWNMASMLSRYFNDLDSFHNVSLAVKSPPFSMTSNTCNKQNAVDSLLQWFMVKLTEYLFASIDDRFWNTSSLSHAERETVATETGHRLVKEYQLIFLASIGHRHELRITPAQNHRSMNKFYTHRRYQPGGHCFRFDEKRGCAVKVCSN